MARKQFPPDCNTKDLHFTTLQFSWELWMVERIHFNYHYPSLSHFKHIVASLRRITRNRGKFQLQSWNFLGWGLKCPGRWKFRGVKETLLIILWCDRKTFQHKPAATAYSSLQQQLEDQSECSLTSIQYVPVCQQQRCWAASDIFYWEK